MSEQKISTGTSPEVVIEEVHGNLQIKGWDRPEVKVQADPHNLQMQEQDEVVSIHCASDCMIRLPMAASLHVNQAYANVHLRLLEDTLHIEAVHGSLYLRNVAETNISKIYGELSARQVNGDLSVGQVSGNATIRDIQGKCTFEEILGNLDLRNVEGDIQAEVSGNTRLRLDTLGGSQYHIKAGGNVHMRLPEDADLQLKLHSDAEYILAKLPEGKELYRQADQELVLGNGAATMQVSAGGSIYLSVRETGWPEDDEPPVGFEAFESLPDDFGEQIARQVEAQIEAQMGALSEQMANLEERIGRSGLSQEDVERLMQRARERSERASTRAQEKVRQAQERLERKLEAQQRRQEKGTQSGEFWGMRYGRHGVHINFPPKPPKPPSDSVSEEERLTILRMLEQKKISLEEAEQLLNALEGQEE